MIRCDNTIISFISFIYLFKFFYCGGFQLDWTILKALILAKCNKSSKIIKRILQDLHKPLK